MAVKAQPFQTRFRFRGAHKQVPKQAAAIVFYHRDNWALINCKMSIGHPSRRRLERVHEAKAALKASPSPMQKLMCGLDCFRWQKRNAGEGGCRCNYPAVIDRRIDQVTSRAVAGRQSPSVGIFVSRSTMQIIYFGMCMDLHPIITAIAVSQTPWI